MSLVEMIGAGHARKQSQDTIAQLRRRDHQRKESSSALEEE